MKFRAIEVQEKWRARTMMSRRNDVLGNKM